MYDSVKAPLLWLLCCDYGSSLRLLLTFLNELEINCISTNFKNIFIVKIKSNYFRPYICNVAVS